MGFDNVDLNNDKSAPKLDLDFGLPAVAAPEDTKKSGGGAFSFGGGWGGSWGFGGADDSKKAETKADDAGWGFGTSTKKDKDKKKGNGFDFNFDDGLAGDDGPGFDLGGTAKKEDKAAEDDPW